MRKNLAKKLIALVSTVALLCTLFSVPVYAEPDVLPQGYEGAAPAKTDGPNTDLPNNMDTAPEEPVEMPEEPEPIPEMAAEVPAAPDTSATFTAEDGKAVTGTIAGSGVNVYFVDETAGTVSVNGEAVCFVPDGESVPEMSEAPVPTGRGPVIATAVPHHGPGDLEPDYGNERSESGKLRETIADVILTVGAALIPFGETIKNIIKFKSPARDGKTGTDLAISFVTEGASFICPLAGPVIAVGKDIVKKLINLF